MRYDTYREKEAKWLKGVVESDEFKAAPVKIVIIHVPPKSSGWHGEAEVARLFAPILNQAGVDAMFCGHIHKWRYDEVGCGMSDADFPVICSPNACRTEVTATSDKIIVEVFDADANKLQTLEINCNKL